MKYNNKIGINCKIMASIHAFLFIISLGLNLIEQNILDGEIWPFYWMFQQTKMQELKASTKNKN